MSRLDLCRCVAFCLALAAVIDAGLRPSSAAAMEAPASGIVVRPETEPYAPAEWAMDTDAAIKFFEERVQRDPHDPMSHTELARMLVRKGRETGGHDYYERAETVIRRAVEFDPSYKPAKVTRAIVHCVHHEFADALRVAQEIHRDDPSDAYVLVLIGDAHLELGNYEEAANAFEEFQRKDPHSGVLSRLARLAELKGDTEGALRLLQRAAHDTRTEGTRETAAWYEMRMGELCFQRGRPKEAAKHFETSLKRVPGYEPGLTGLAQTRAAEGLFGDAIALYRQAVASAPRLPTLAALRDLCERTGAPGTEQLQQELTSQAANPDAHGRDLLIYYADYDLELPRALELARKQFAAQKDIYTCDALAWVLHKNQHYQEAAKAMAQAMKLGTQDAILFFHAGMIHYALGDNDRARRYLRRALDLNPHFSLRYAPVARRLLAELRPRRK